MGRKKDKERAVITKNIFVAVLVITFLVGIILIFYRMLYDAKREAIITKGETAAKETAQSFDNYLLTSIDAIKLTAYTLEEMLNEGRDSEAITSYICEQTVTVKSAIFENTTGLYGYIDGKYYDGLLWEPPEWYVPTQRQWYIKAVDMKGEVTMIEPYLDAETGSIVVTISKLLKDGKSVVALDITLDTLQTVTDSLAAEGESDWQFVMDKKGYVTAHSDHGQIGKIYSQESGTLGAKIYEQLKESGDSKTVFCEFDYDNIRYIVYAAQLQHDFLCVSVKDATSIFRPLKLILILTIAAVTVVIAIISAIMIVSNKKQLMMERLGMRLSASADIYLSMHEINLLTDTFTEVRNTNEQAAHMMGDSGLSCQERLCAVMSQFSDPSSREELLDFVDFRKLDMRLRDRNTVTLEWLNADKKWRRSRFIVSDRTSSGIVSKVMYLVEDIDAEKKERDKTLEAIKMMNEQISSVAGIYFKMVDYDIENNTMRTINTDSQDISDIFEGVVENAKQYVISSLDSFVSETSRKEILDFISIDTINERMKDTNTITEEFLSNEYGWCRARLVASKRNEDGSVAHVLWMVEDIDEEKRRRDRLTEAAETMNAQISSIANIYMTAHELDIATDTFTEIKSDKDYINTIIGSARDNAQVSILKVMETVTDSSYVDGMRRFLNFSTLEKRMRRTDTLTIEYQNEKKLWRRGRFVASKRDENGKLLRVIWLIEDIDNEKRERDKLIDMSQRALAASEAKSAFLSNMSHEIRTPINAVLGMNEMILRECDDQSVLEYSNSIKTAGSTLLGLINDILDFSKIEAGKMEIIPVDYDLSSIINDLVNMIQAKADSKGLKLILDINKEIPKLLHGDEVRIKQVITNILTNAVKYTESGSVTFSMDYERAPSDDNKVVLIVAVKDTGIGIKKEDVQKLFSEFERIDEERNRNIEGTGLGMSITKRLLEMMGSKLEVESIYKLGSKFSFKLEQLVVKWEEIGDYEAAYKASIGNREKYHERFKAPEAEILVVDDTPENLTVFKSLLKQTQVRIDTAASGDEGLSLSLGKKYDILFLDHMMPEKDGIETLHELRSRQEDPNSDTPAVCLTANAISGAREKYLAEGFDDYLTKPIDSDKLELLLLQYLPEDKIMACSEDAAPEEKSVETSWYEGIEGIDPVAAVKNSGSESALRTVMQSYYEAYNARCEELQSYYDAKDWKNYTIKVHALKSSSRLVGALKLGDDAQAMETAGNDNNEEYLLTHHDELMAEFKTIHDAMSGVFSSENDLPDIPSEVLEDAYGGIAEFAGAKDYELVSMVMESVKEYRLPPADEERFKMIQKSLSKMDWDSILDCIAKR